ncbi:hypothetical protein SAMN05444354_101721 [Stigmatella aurantiaca]|uniref:Uncharacterized protein n=1 Tax=Stigmatella aurantiaca TaxID=41 RepID=A0A1H7HI65_STIAU|nr:hypothetical protein [Stigmatella aurantiaca]SEK49858.1 hypothetical protein SAMN05444354_101721 [Stigmatella aurantiaca]
MLALAIAKAGVAVTLPARLFLVPAENIVLAAVFSPSLVRVIIFFSFYLLWNSFVPGCLHSLI